MATIKIPPVLRPSVGGEKEVQASGVDVGAVLSQLAEQHPATQSQLFGPDGSLNRYVNVYLNDEDVRVLDGLGTSVEDDTLVILPARGSCLAGIPPPGDPPVATVFSSATRAATSASQTRLMTPSANSAISPSRARLAANAGASPSRDGGLMRSRERALIAAAAAELEYERPVVHAQELAVVLGAGAIVAGTTQVTGSLAGDRVATRTVTRSPARNQPRRA